MSNPVYAIGSTILLHKLPSKALEDLLFGLSVIELKALHKECKAIADKEYRWTVCRKIALTIGLIVINGDEK